MSGKAPWRERERRRHGAPPSIRRNGSNDQYEAQDLPYAGYPAELGVVYRAGTSVGGRKCPRCPAFIAVTSKVVRLARPERRRWWVHARCATPAERGEASS